jgi:hypothetical protein
MWLFFREGEHAMKAHSQQVKPPRIAASFYAELPARSAANAVRNVTGLRPFQVRILSPRDAPRSRRSLLPDAVMADSASRPALYARSRTLWAALLGVIGILVWWVLRTQLWVERAPFVWLIIFCLIGVIVGAIAAARLTLRSGEAGLFHEVRSALRAGRWAVVFYPTDAAQAEAVRSALRVRTDHVSPASQRMAATDAAISGYGF